MEWQVFRQDSRLPFKSEEKVIQLESILNRLAQSCKNVAIAKGFFQ